jgi:ACS family glucarate transporter-like MFS transporter
LRDLVGSISLWALCAASFGVSFAWYFYSTWLPKYLKVVFGIKFEDSEILTGLPFLFGAVGCLGGGFLSDALIARTGSRRWGRSLLGVGGFAGAGLCVLATGYVTQSWQAVTLLCLASFINDLAIPVIWAVSADIGGRYVGTVAGIMNTAGAIGGAISPVLIPYLDRGLQHFEAAFRWQIILSVLACAWFLSAAAWLFIDASQPLFAGDNHDHAP